VLFKIHFSLLNSTSFAIIVNLQERLFRLVVFYFCASSVATAVYSAPDSGSDKFIPSKSKSPNSPNSPKASGFSRDLNYAYSFGDTNNSGFGTSLQELQIS